VDKEKRRLLRGYQQLVATLLLSLADALMDAADDCCEQELDLAKIGRILPSSLEWVDGKEYGHAESGVPHERGRV